MINILLNQKLKEFTLKSNYFIKDTFKPRKTPNIIYNGIYWNQKRLNSPFLYQYSTYKFCKKLIKKFQLHSVLDIGCGTANKLMNLIYPVCKNIYGIDRKNIIEYCKKIYNLGNFFADDIENSKLKLEKKFDLIISADVIEHLIDPDKLLSIIKNYCHNDTFVVISTPERDILRGRNRNYSPNKEHIREWNSLEFINYLKHNDFHILYHKTVNLFKLRLKLKKPLMGLLLSFFELLKLHISRRIKSSQILLCKIRKNSNSSN